MRMCFFACLIFFFACSNSHEKTGFSADGHSCYIAQISRDSVLLELDLKGDSAFGKLEFRMFEKDQSIGTFSGKLSGDTLLILYTFQSEGMQSQSEMAFLRKGDDLIQGYSPMEQIGTLSKFKNPKQIDFNSSILLKTSNCQSSQ